VKVRTNNGKLLEFVHGPSYCTFVSGSTSSCNLLKRAVRVRRSLPLRSIHVEEKSPHVSVSPDFHGEVREKVRCGARLVSSKSPTKTTMTPWALPALFSSREGKENEVLTREDIGKTGAKAPKFPSPVVVV